MIELGKSNKYINVLVISDHFMCYAQAYVMPSQTASVVVKIVLDKSFVNYGLQDKIISD